MTDFIIIQLSIIAPIQLVLSLTSIVRSLKIYFYGDEWISKSWKPFDCPLCLTFWVSLIVNCYLYGIVGFTIACINAIIAQQLERYFKK
jgi:hypothetical protein